MPNDRKKQRAGSGGEPQETLVEKIQARGLRLTGPRRIVAELLDGATEHLDADTVIALARKKDPTIHRATVYRTLQTLKRQGLIDELDLMHVDGERHYYEVRPSSLHIHLVCTRCKGVEEPSGPFWDRVKERVERESGFRPEVVRIEMAGVCLRCRDGDRRRGRRPGPRTEGGRMDGARRVRPRG